MKKLYEELDRLDALLKDSANWDNELLGCVLAQKRAILEEIAELER